MNERQFRVLGRSPIKTVPWSFVADLEEEALSYHGQSLEVLNSRGGLSPLEMYALKNRKRLFELQGLTEDWANHWLADSLKPTEASPSDESDTPTPDQFRRLLRNTERLATKRGDRIMELETAITAALEADKCQETSCPAPTRAMCSNMAHKILRQALGRE